MTLIPKRQFESASLEITVETGNPEMGYMKSRWATIKIGGVPVFSELVYDVDKDGKRTEEQARQNILNQWAERMRRLQEDA